MAERKYGARVFRMDDQTALVVQTVKSGEAQNAPYVIDRIGSKNCERWARLDDDSELAAAVRAALAGQLEP